MTLDTFMRKMDLQYIDVLKIDIEGAKKEVFENSSSWIGNVGVIMAELHEHVKTGCSQAFSNATQGFSEIISTGETLVRLNKTVAR